MNQSKNSDPNLLRKLQLKRQILKALDSPEDETLTILKGQWVHRYGFETLHEIEGEIQDFTNETLEDEILVDEKVNSEAEIEGEIQDFTNETLEDEILVDEKVNSEAEIEGEIQDFTNETLEDEILVDEAIQFSPDNPNKDISFGSSGVNNNFIEANNEDNNEYTANIANDSDNSSLENKKLNRKNTKKSLEKSVNYDSLPPAPPSPDLKNLRRWLSNN